MRENNCQLLELLPAVYNDSEELAVLLAVFEAVLFGPENIDTVPKKQQRSLTALGRPLVENIAAIPFLFDAYETPGEFLPWLSSWVALSNYEGLREDAQRQLLADIVPLYAQRGTCAYMKKLLTYFIPEGAIIEVNDQETRQFIVGQAIVASTTRFEQENPFWFKVDITLFVSLDEMETINNKILLGERIRRVIDLAKPAHTLYELKIHFLAKESKTI